MTVEADWGVFFGGAGGGEVTSRALSGRRWEGRRLLCQDHIVLEETCRMCKKYLLQEGNSMPGTGKLVVKEFGKTSKICK